MMDRDDMGAPFGNRLSSSTGPASGSGPSVYDKTGREIMLGDVLKVYHFTGARWRKRYFMYKQVTGERVWPNGFECWFLSHLNLDAADGYYLARDDKILSDYEIVQSVDASFHDRPRVTSDRDGARSAETACPAPVPQDRQARAEGIAQTTPAILTPETGGKNG